MNTRLAWLNACRVTECQVDLFWSHDAVWRDPPCDTVWILSCLNSDSSLFYSAQDKIQSLSTGLVLLKRKKNPLCSRSVTGTRDTKIKSSFTPPLSFTLTELRDDNWNSIVQASTTPYSTASIILRKINNHFKGLVCKIQGDLLAWDGMYFQLHHYLKQRQVLF